MSTILVFPLHYFQELLYTLVQNPEGTCYWPLGQHKQGEDLLLLARNAHLRPSADQIFGRYISISQTRESLSMGDWVLADLEGGAVAHLFLGRETAQGNWWGAARDAGGNLTPIQELRLVGAEMPVLKMSSLSKNGVSEEPSPINIHHFQRWSRTIGAMSLPAWERLGQMSFAIVGCGRSGSALAVSLIKSGVRQIQLIDKDRVELHNIPEMDGVTEKDLDRYKAEVLADYLQNHCASPSWPVSITAHTDEVVSVYREALKSDVIVCCVDNDRARLACGILASLFHRVLLDIGSGILSGDENTPTIEEETLSPVASRQMGSDIRLIVPGHGCLRCCGGLTNYDRAVKELARLVKPIEEPWWVQRRGSLRTLNMTAVHLGLQILNDFLEGRVRESLWIRLQYSPDGNPALENSPFRGPGQDCPLCAKGGLGDDGLYWD